MSGYSYRCWAEIDLAALERNVGRIRGALPQRMRYIAVVKADAYGHGVIHMATRLMQCGADAFAVANVNEASVLREIGRGWPILVLGPVLPHEQHVLVAEDLIAALSSEDELERYQQLGREHGRPVRVHLKIDTGMGRVGVWYEQAAALFEKARAASHVQLEGIFTHFSSADSDPEFTALQRVRFLKALETFRLNEAEKKSLVIHADNSSGIDTFTADSPFNAVRVGLLQFGLKPHPGTLLDAIRPEPVLSLHARIGLIKQLPSGMAVSYGRTYTLTRDTRLAVLTLGYGDGLSTAASNRGYVLIGGRRCPVRGRITMDQTIVDITDLEVPVRVGDEAILIGQQGAEEIGVREYSEWGRDIPWESLCSLTKRVPRIYKTPRLI